MRIVYTSLALLVSLDLAACGDDAESHYFSDWPARPVGTLEAALTLPDGLRIDRIDFVIEDFQGSEVRRGPIHVHHSREVVFQVGRLPFAEGYEIALSAEAKSSTETLACGGRASFDILGPGVSRATLPLVCQRPGPPSRRRKVRVSVEVTRADEERCPVVTGLTALPTEVMVGNEIALEAHLEDAPDTQVGWTGSGGSFSTPQATTSVFTCEEPGTFELAFSATKARCITSMNVIEVECSPADN